jgi:hypothetical protein
MPAPLRKLAHFLPSAHHVRLSRIPTRTARESARASNPLDCAKTDLVSAWLSRTFHHRRSRFWPCSIKTIIAWSRRNENFS